MLGGWVVGRGDYFIIAAQSWLNAIVFLFADKMSPWREGFKISFLLVKNLLQHSFPFSVYDLSMSKERVLTHNLQGD